MDESFNLNEAVVPDIVDALLCRIRHNTIPAPSESTNPIQTLDLRCCCLKRRLPFHHLEAVIMAGLRTCPAYAIHPTKFLPKSFARSSSSPARCLHPLRSSLASVRCAAPPQKPVNFCIPSRDFHSSFSNMVKAFFDCSWEGPELEVDNTGKVVSKGEVKSKCFAFNGTDLCPVSPSSKSQNRLIQPGVCALPFAPGPEYPGLREALGLRNWKRDADALRTT